MKKIVSLTALSLIAAGAAHAEFTYNHSALQLNQLDGDGLDLFTAALTGEHEYRYDKFLFNFNNDTSYLEDFATISKISLSAAYNISPSWYAGLEYTYFGIDPEGFSSDNANFYTAFANYRFGKAIVGGSYTDSDENGFDPIFHVMAAVEIDEDGRLQADVYESQGDITLAVSHDDEIGRFDISQRIYISDGSFFGSIENLYQNRTGYNFAPKWDAVGYASVSSDDFWGVGAGIRYNVFDNIDAEFMVRHHEAFGDDAQVYSLIFEFERGGKKINPHRNPLDAIVDLSKSEVFLQDF